MKLTYILVLFLNIASADKKCRGVYFNERYYDIEILKEGVNNVHEMTLSHVDNTLYFTLDQLSTSPTKILGYFNMDTRISGVVDGIRNATALAVDQRHGTVFVGGSDGIYALNQNKIPEKLGISDSIQSMFFKNALYYVTKNRQAFRYSNGIVDLVRELDGVSLDDIIADDDDNLFFLEARSLFRIKLHTRAVNVHERYVVDAMAADYFYKPYVCTTDGVYVYNKYKYALERASTLRNLRALTFSKMNDPIYAVADVIVKLNPNPVPCHEY